MCLYIGNKEGHIAKRDIICFKRLEKVRDGEYVTPMQRWKVKPGSTLVPDQSKPDITENGYKWQLNGGVIHCYSGYKLEAKEITLFKAIIPKGTRFWIQDDITQFAAEKLVLTNEQVDSSSIQLDLAALLDYAADVRLKDGKRCSVLDIDSNLDEVVGVYAYGDQAISIEFNTSGIKFAEDNPHFDKKIHKTTSDSAKKDKDGEKNCKYLENHYSSANLKAIQYCRERGGFLPSVEQLMNAFKAMSMINLTLEYLGKPLIPFGYWFWSSTIRNEEEVWYVNSGGYWGSWDGAGYYWGGRYVIPFLSSFENSEA